MKITNLSAREILDSRGTPTIEAKIILDNGIEAIAKVASGASTGTHEAMELRDNDLARYQGKGVLKAVDNVNNPIKKALIGLDVVDQQKIDQRMIKLDGTENKGRLGANAILSVSMVVCRAASEAQNISLFKYIGSLIGNNSFNLPEPMILIMEGGKHGNWAMDIQEFMIIPAKEFFPNFQDKLVVAEKIFSSLQNILLKKKYDTKIGLEGAFCPSQIKSNEEALDLLCQASQKAGYKINEEVFLAIDVAASEFYVQAKYCLKSENNLTLTSNQWMLKLLDWTKKYHVFSWEDAFFEEDWTSWVKLTSLIGSKSQIIGDDLLTTNIRRIQKAINLKAVNGVLIKPNQIGTVTETLDAIKLTKSAGFNTIISHRAGETNDDFIADLCVGTGSKQCKFGGPFKEERRVKYERLLEIERELKV